MEPMFCACCNRPIEPRHAWRGATDKFYCSGFCADSEYVDFPLTAESVTEFDDGERKAA